MRNFETRLKKLYEIAKPNGKPLLLTVELKTGNVLTNLDNKPIISLEEYRTLVDSEEYDILNFMPASKAPKDRTNE